MHGDVQRPTLDLPRPSDRDLWIASLLFFGIGDLLTTGIGLELLGVAEGNHLIAALVERHGFAALALVKLLVLGGCYALWRWLPRAHRSGVPLGLATLGVLVTGWNTVVLTVALVA